MPDLEISKLPVLAADNLQASDPVPLSDLSASETKKITVKDLVQAGISLIDDGSIPSDKVEGGTGQVGVGQIVAGDNITISPITGIGTVTVNATATPYTLPIASDVVLGGIKVGNNLSISDSGVLSAVSSGGSSYKGLADFTGAEPDAVNGDFYINTTAGTGAWSGFVGDPVSEGQRAIFNGTDWDLLPSDTSENYWQVVASDYGTDQALRPVAVNDGLEIRGPYNYNPGTTASEFAIFEADNPNNRAKLEWRKDNASLTFEKEIDAPDGSSNPSVSVDIDGNLKLRDGIVTANPTRSSDWDSAGSVMIRTTNYSENTFAVNYMGDVDIRRSLSVGNIGTSGSRLPGVIKGISRDDEDSSILGFSLEFGADKPFTVDYAGNLYLAGQVEAVGGIKFGDGTVQTTAGGGAGGAVTKIVAGDNVTLDPPSGVGEVTINATGGGTGAVESVNGETGVVVLDAADVGAVKIGDVNPTYFANQAAFPDASSSAVHGGVAHSHADGAMFFAHSGVWTELANASDVGEGLWEEDGNAVTPKKTGADLKIEGEIASNEQINAGGPAYADAAIYAANNTTDEDKSTFRAYNAAEGGLVWGAYNAAGSLVTSKISEDGSATFDGRIKASSGYFDVKDGAQGVSIYNSSGTSSDKNALAISDNGGGTPKTIELKYDGSGTFKGDVAVGEATTTFLDKAAAIAALTEQQRTLFAAAIAAWNARPEPYAADDPSTLPADLPLREAIVRATTEGKINLNGDTGEVICNTIRSTTTGGSAGLYVYNNGGSNENAILVSPTNSGGDVSYKVNWEGKVTARTFDLDALDPLPA